ncbi:MAG: ABC transporter substrate-binding protein [Gemmatimonadetes bacterium]|nr:ABC transporter substrate-binding protein [Gemmatimonadota bacterium]
MARRGTSSGRGVTICRLAVVLACVGAIGCGSGSDRAGPDEAVGRTIAIGVEAAATTVYPPLSAAALDFELGGAVFPGLNFGVWEAGALTYPMGHPSALARSWELDGARLTYHLDTSRRWSDGAPIRAADVQFTFDLLADTTLALPLASVAARIDSITAPDDSTAVFHFASAYPGMLFDTGVGLLPSHVLAAVDRSGFMGGLPVPDGAAPSDIPVSGPFRIGEWRPEDRIVLTRNENASAPARLERVVIRVIPDEATRAAELAAGSLHAARFNSFRLARRAGADGARLLAVPQRGYDYIAWNGAAHPALASVEVRQALSLGIDRDALIEALDLTGFAEPAWGPYGSLFDRLRAPPPHEPLFDPPTARALLDASGWVDADGDGVRERDDRELAIELAVPSGNDRREDAAEIIQSQLADLGVRLTIRPTEFNALFGQLLAGRYEAALMGWQVGLDPDISGFWGDPAAPLNVVELDDPDVRAAIEAALGETDGRAAEPHWRSVGERVAAAYPYAFLWYFDLPLAVASDLRGVEVDAGGWGAGLGSWSLDSTDP